jgi:hypothetical protein
MNMIALATMSDRQKRLVPGFRRAGNERHEKMLPLEGRPGGRNFAEDSHSAPDTAGQPIAVGSHGAAWTDLPTESALGYAGKRQLIRRGHVLESEPMSSSVSGLFEHGSSSSVFVCSRIKLMSAALT